MYIYINIYIYIYIYIYVCIFLSFIDYSFQERRTILRGEQLEGSSINIKLI